jgi:hypothetical protein
MKKRNKKYTPKPNNGFGLIAKLTAKAHVLTPSNKNKAAFHVKNLREKSISATYDKRDADNLAYAAAFYESLARKGYSELEGKWLDALCNEFNQVTDFMLNACENGTSKGLTEDQLQAIENILTGFLLSCKDIPEIVFFTTDKEVRNKLQIKENEK